MDITAPLLRLRNGRNACIANWHTAKGLSRTSLTDIATDISNETMGIIDNAIASIATIDNNVRNTLATWAEDGARKALITTQYTTQACKDSTILWAVRGQVTGTSLSECFANCYNLLLVEGLYVDNNGTEDDTCDTILKARSMFENCYTLESLPTSLCLRGVTDASYMYSYCYALQTLPSGMTFDSVTNATAMFRYCYALQALPDGTKFDKVTTTTDMFMYCRSLTSLPSTLTFENVVNAGRMFGECLSLTALPSSVNLSKVTNITRIFASCTSLTTVANAFANGTGVIINANTAFYNCRILTTIEGSLNIGGITFWGSTSEQTSNNSAYGMFSNSGITHCLFSGTYQFDFDIDLTKWGFQNLDEQSIVSFISCLQTTTSGATITLTTTQKAWEIEEDVTIEDYCALLGYSVQ